MNVRYLNEKKASSEETKKKILIIIAMVLGSFNLFLLAFAIIQAKDVIGLIMSLVFLAIDVLLFWIGIRAGKVVEMARRYETIFGSDEDGYVMIGEISTLLQQPQKKVYLELRKLFARGYFLNCRMETNGTPMVYLLDVQANNPQLSDGVGFVICTCGNCGTQNRIRAGSMSKCYACHAPLQGTTGPENRG